METSTTGGIMSDARIQRLREFRWTLAVLRDDLYELGEWHLSKQANVLSEKIQEVIDEEPAAC